MHIISYCVLIISVYVAAPKLLKIIGSQLLRVSTTLAGEKELRDLNDCLRQVGEKREKALAKRKRNQRLGTHLTTWSEDDRYADGKFYQKKLQECVDVHGRFHRELRRAKR